FGCERRGRRRPARRLTRPRAVRTGTGIRAGLLARRQTAEFPTFFVPELYVPLAKYGATDERPRVFSAAASWIPRPDAVGPWRKAAPGFGGLRRISATGDASEAQDRRAGRRHQVIMSKLGRTYQLAVIASLAVAAILAALALTDLRTPFSPSHRVHVAIQTCGAIVLCFAAFLVFERFHTDAHSHAARLTPAPQRLADVGLAPALGLLALATLLFSAIPAIIGDSPGAFAIWGQTLGQIGGMGAGAAAAWIPTRCTVRRRVTAAQTAGAVGVGLVVVAPAALAALRLLLQ